MIDDKTKRKLEEAARQGDERARREGKRNDGRESPCCRVPVILIQNVGRCAKCGTVL